MDKRLSKPAPQPLHPVQDALTHYFFSRLRGSYQRLTELPEVDREVSLRLVLVSQQRWASVAEKVRKRSPDVAACVIEHRNLNEVYGWLYPTMDTREEREQQARRVEEMFAKIGAPYEPAKVMVNAIRKGRSGAAKSKRTLAIKTLEAKMLDSDFHWRSFTRKHCNCGKSSHDLHCEEAMRQAAGDLRRMLHRLGIDVQGLH